MILVNRPETDPFFNIATEEFLLKHSLDDIVMVWQSSPSVIVGKHQNAFAEVNLDYVKANKIPVIRRISGGGTVYHDLGNINYTVIITEKNTEKLIDFRKFTNPAIQFLKTLSIQADFEGNNNLAVNGKKISGNSAHIMKNKVMHHGTLLFDSNLEQLENSIKPPKFIIKDKAVKSVRASVANIREMMKNKMTVTDFKEEFQLFLSKYYHINLIYPISIAEKLEIENLVRQKYSRREWNFSYSPAYEVENTINISGKKAHARFVVKEGIIGDLTISIPTHEILCRNVSEKLAGCAHDKDIILNKLYEINHIFEENKLQVNEMLTLFF